MLQTRQSHHLTANVWAAAGGVTRSARLRLFCLPPAGNGAALFRSWIDRLAPEIDVVPVTLPGREMRFSEPPIAKLDQLLEEVATGLRPLCDRPYALFGYSMGALLAHRLAHRWAADGLGEPKHLFAAAHRAPGVPRREPELHRLPHHLLWDSLARYDGIPPEIMENHELRAVLEPRLRADLALVETAGPPPDLCLNCPITAIGGAADKAVSIDDLTPWRDATRGQFERLIFPGHHFFITSSHQELQDAIATRLQEQLD